MQSSIKKGDAGDRQKCTSSWGVSSEFLRRVSNEVLETTAKNISAKDKNTRSPVKSPEKDHDVSFDQSEQNYSRHFA